LVTDQVFRVLPEKQKPLPISQQGFLIGLGVGINPSASPSLVAIAPNA